MDGIGSSLPSMPEPASPLSMKQPPESLAGRKGRGDVSGDPALLMDQAAAHLAATLQDTVLQKMTGHAHSNHSHERLKDLTSRVLNGDQDKSAKLCAPETPVLKAAEALATSATHQRRCPAHSDPELKLQITQMVPQPRFEPCEGVLSGGDAAQEVKKRKGRARKAKPPSKPGSPATGAIANPVPPGCMQIPQLAVPEVQVVPDQKEVQAVPDQKEVQEVPDQKEVQEVPDQKEVQEVPDQKGVQGVPDQKEVQGNQDQKEVRGNQDQKEVQGNQDQKEVQGNQDQKKVQGILDEKEVQGILEVHRVKAVQEVKEHSPQVRFCVGDVVWTKVSGYPWWPCMVSTDPEIEQHVKPKRRGIGPPGLLYHVQYFGDCPERGYIFEKSMVLFTGEAGQYEELSQANKQPASRLIRKRGTALVPRKFQAQWSMGITQAQEAVNMPLDERMDKFTYVYGDDGPHLNPHVVEKLKPAEHEGTEQGVESRLIPLPAVQVTVALQSTSAGKKPPVACAKKKVGKRRNQGEPTRSLATKKPESPTCAKESLVPEPDAQDFNTALCSETQSEVGETQQTKSKANQTGHSKTWKTDKIKSLSATASTSEPRKKNTLKKLSPKDGSSESAQSTLSVKKGRKKKGRDEETMVTAKRKTSCKRPLTETTADQTDQQPKRKLKTSKGAEKLKALAPETTPNKTQRRRKETEKDVKQVKKRQKVSLSGDPSPEDQRHGRKRKREVCEQQPSSSKTKKRRSSLCHESEGSGSEERPGSPSDSLDEAKKGERNNGTRKEFVCQVCEQPGEDLLACEGQCYGMFHLSCLGLSLKPEDKLLCQECSTGVHSCFSCKKPAGELRRCYVPNCGKFYHEACARLSTLTVFDNRGFRCPLHTCLSCHLSCRTNGKATKGKMMRCLRCPTAYHVGDVCVAAGSHMVTNTSVVCTNHFHAKKGYSHHSHLNVSWCFVCSKGGQLLCCESCPAAFHPDCLNITMPDGSWFCNDCRAGKKPKYHDIIWVKLGTYRWWPAEIRHPRNVPTNIQHLRHQIGEFPVFFFGSRDFFWTHQGRVFPYMEGDRGSKHQTTGIGKVFKNALLEAEARFKEMKMKREAKEAQENNKKPPPYKFIKVNKPCGKVQVYTADISEIPKCNCTPSDERPCGFESECLNRMLLYECHPQVCPSGGHCCNQDFTKRLYPDTKIIKTAGKGWGLICLRDIKKGEFVNEYIGELIDEEECRARIRYAQENNITHFYMLTIDKDRIIDAGPKGNYSRFMNHSCQPNCETQKWTVNGDTRVGLFAVCDIPAGTELTFNYNLDCLGNEKTVCHCDAPNCSGFLGDRPKTSSAASSEIKAKKTKRRKRRSEGKKSEDECFRCGDGGELVLCDKKSCTKAYHVSCLHLAKRPFGRWDCPWHHCDVCGKNSEAFCQLCPNSFCRLHQEGALEAHPSTGQLQCLEHEEQERPMEPPQTNPRPTKASRKKAEA